MTSEEDQGEFVFEGKLEANTIYEWVKDYHSANPTPDENVQHPKLKPKLRFYQERAVRWMLSMERADNRTVRIANDDGKLVRFDKGGILADEMGLGKTVEVLACLLANPNTEYVKQLEEYIDKMKDDLLKYEADDIKNADESTEMETENREEETSRPQRRRKIKQNVVNVEVISGNVATQNECLNKTKRRRGKSVYSEILDCTLFENNLSQNENNLCENENNLCENENNVSQNENNMCETENNLSQNENNLSQNENNVCQNENNLSQNENNVCQNENNLCENENNLSQNENNLTQNENNWCENENNLSQNENNLCENENNISQNENNVCQNENNVCENDVPQNVDALGEETGADLRKFESLCTEFNLRNRLEDDKDAKKKPEQGDKNFEDEANDVVGDDGDRRGFMEVESKNPIEEDGGDGLKASDKQVIDEVESKTCGRKRSRKAVAPKKNNKLLKKNSDHEDEEDEDFVFKTPASLTPSKPPSRRSTAGTTPRQKKKNDEISEDSDSDFVCKSTDSASSSRRSTRRKQSMVVCDDMLFDGDVDDPGVVDDPVKVTSAPRRRPRTKSKSDDPDFAPAPKKRAKSAKSGLLRAEMQKMYEAMLAETSPALKRAKIALLKMESDYRCCCLDPSLLSDAITVQCPICRKLQHPDCVGFESAVPYVCFTCWPQRALVPSSATLIVTPNSISSQWSDEIKKHLADSDLKVLVYEGVRGGEGYKQPLQLAQYDIVVTTYQVLLKEIDYVNEDPGNRPRAMRYARKFFPPTSPLTCVKWWRICLDEAQMVECITSKLYTMVSALHTVNRWAVCGTPIQRQVADLFGLVAFLRVDPYGSSKTSWHSLESNRQALAEFLPHVMWRTSKCHVLHELNVPPQTTCVHWLAFAPVETFFYRKQHALCSHQFQHKAQQLLGRQPLSKPLCQVASKHLSALLAPLLRLRQACVHPQLVKSQFVTIRHTLTMGELLDQMVAKATLDAEEALRQLVASLNGVAGARLLTGEAIEAVNMYRRVLHLAQEYEGRLKMDTLQKIHTMYNLATVLQSNTVSVAPTLRDATLLDDVKSLETDYLIKRLGDVEGTKAALKELGEKFAAKIPSKKLRGCDWWSDMLHDIDTKQLLHKIQVEFEHAKGPLMAMLTKMSGLLGLMEELYQWQIRIDKTRQSVIEQIKQMEEVPTAVMAGHAVNCHLRNQKPSTVNNRCLICRTENELKHYESLLFWIMNKDDTKSKSPSKKRDEKDDYEWQQLQKQQSARSSGADTNQKTTVANLENNTIFEVYNVGTWKPSQHEQIIRLIYSSHSKRLLNREWTEESQKQFSALDILRKEFRRLRLLWSQIADQVAASDELVMAKLRLRLATTEEYLADEQLAGSSRRITALRKNDNEKRNVICPLQVDAVIGQLQAEAAVNESALKKTAGTLYYLQNLQKNGDKQTEPCPVCKNQLTDTWSVLKCGHCYCYDCIHTLTHSFKRESITCPVCRECTPSADVSHIEARHTSAHSQIKAQVNGSFTTKIEAMVAELLALRAEQPDVKVLMFSVWDGVLDVLGEALSLNEVVYCRLSSTNSRKRKWQTVLETFKSDPCACALLMPLRSGAKGLNLVEATHVFLAEPILNPADELQAVGRVHRIGQTRETFVHKFAVKGTIEEKMLTAMEGSDSNWSKDKVTVQQLLDLFTPF